jgi:hypothetical protein
VVGLVNGVSPLISLDVKGVPTVKKNLHVTDGRYGLLISCAFCGSVGRLLIAVAFMPLLGGNLYWGFSCVESPRLYVCGEMMPRSWTEMRSSI